MKMFDYIKAIAEVEYESSLTRQIHRSSANRSKR